MAAGTIGRHLVIRGRVQGVGYRDAMRQEALRLGVRGWVRNRRDGTVEAVIEGPTKAVELILRWAHRGPEPANVARVEITEDLGTYTAFTMLPSE
jgi:acylphosphatase